MKKKPLSNFHGKKDLSDNPNQVHQRAISPRKKKLSLGRRGLNGSPCEFLGKQFPKERKTFLRKMGTK
jgi:hypothetical protein